MRTIRLQDDVEPDPEVLGGKAASLVRIAGLGLPVPPAFVLPTSVCAEYHGDGGGPAVVAALAGELRDGVEWLATRLARTFGRGPRPLLVSVRSGAPRSMPGMMDTILNLGAGPGVQEALAAESGDPAWAAAVSRRFHEQYHAITGAPAPEDPWEQLAGAVDAVLRSWHSPRAVAYRAHEGLPDTPGTAVTVQAMVFGNLDDRSCTGVLFTRDPNTGEAGPYGEWLPRAQGEDLVSGEVTPRRLDELAATNPALHEELVTAGARLERAAGDMQDVEFTVQGGRLFVLQARAGKRSGVAAVRIAVDLARAGIIPADEAIERIAGRVDDLGPRQGSGTAATGRLLASGLAASPGRAGGVVVTTADEAHRRAAAGETVVLVRPTTSPADVHGMIAAAAIVTEVGGATSHAALVSRDLGRPCVVGCGPGSLAGLEGASVVVDGSAGQVLEALGAPRGPEPGLPAPEPGPAADPELTALQLLAFKRRVVLTDLRELAGDADAVERLVAEGLVLVTGEHATLSPAGKQARDERLAAERPGLDAEALRAAYAAFGAANDELKEVVVAWQLRTVDGVQVPNDHADPAYDASVLDRLAALHEAFGPTLEAIARAFPRAAAYRARLDRALQAARSDRRFVASPLLDSFHTAWFELHQDLIDALALDRLAEESAAARPR